MKDLKLYEFFAEDVKDPIYVFSTINDHKVIREYINIWDHGGMPYEDFEKALQTGECTLIRALSEISEEDLDVIPYCTDEKIDGKYIDNQMTIAEYFYEKL